MINYKFTGIEYLTKEAAILTIKELGKKWVFQFTDVDKLRKVEIPKKLNDDECKLNYIIRKDNSGKTNYNLEWRIYDPMYRSFIEFHIQTWDYVVAYVWTKYPHKVSYTNPKYWEVLTESSIIENLNLKDFFDKLSTTYHING